MQISPQELHVESGMREGVGGDSDTILSASACSTTTIVFEFAMHAKNIYSMHVYIYNYIHI